MDEQSVGVRAGNVGKAAARGFVATALTLSLVPSLAYASPENEEETAPQATNSEAISPVSETSDGVSTQNYTYDLSKIADGTYTSTIDLKDIEGAVAAGEEDEWELYDLTVKVTVADHKISNVDVTATNPEASDKYVKWAKEGRTTTTKNVAGVPSQIVDKQSTTIDTVTKATYSSKAIAAATDKALQAAYDEQNTKPVDPTPAEDEYTYGYAGLTWAEYWAAEGVYNADNTSTSDVKDSHNEYDKGGFDVVTRATTNHGLHRGSYQCIATIYGASGAKYGLATWSADGKSFTTTDGKTIQYNKGAMTLDDGTTDTVEHYEVSGLKYVPVKVKTSDLEAFKAKYAFVENGSTLAGGYSENKLQAYSVTAEVDADTNGLKTVTKSGDSFSFGKAATGTTSGIKDQALKTATGLTTEVKAASGSYGEFLRVDLGGDYGDLGANMQSVTWTYYGDDSTYTNAKRTFGTKFAADNWMHKSMNIQLGLTESARCELPEGTNGVGYWTLTVHALGYADYTVQFEATEDNIVGAKEEASDELKAELQALVDKADALTESSYTADSWKNLSTELQESKDLLAKQPVYKGEVTEQITHLTEAINNLVKVAPEAGDYILMNIPYDEFYATETAGNDTKVDVFTSATKNKVRTGSLSGGSYHKDSTGDEISGITYAVKVTEDAAKKIDWSKYTQITDDSSVDVTVTNRGKTSTTTYKGKDALFEADTYSYYILGSDEQANYKELTVDADGNLSFSALKGDVKSGSATIAEFTTESTYGDYELDLGDDVKTTIGQDATVYGVVVNTTDGTGYGMRHLENIWRTTELAWCTGFTSAVHNCPTSSEHYKSMMGKTIDSVTYYTSTGVYKLDIDDTYVPIKSAESKLSVTAEVDAKTAQVEATLPFENPTFKVDGNKVTVTAGADTTTTSGQFDITSLKPGKYTLVASDPKGEYADVSADFTVSTAKAVAQVKDNAVTKADSASEDDFSNYTGNITKVTVDGTSYSATGRGSVAIVNKDGSINTAAESNGKKVFDGYGEHSIVVESTGYTTNVEGTVTLEADKSALEAAITKGQDVVNSEEASTYSADTLNALKSAIEAGQKVSDNKAATDEEVASAAQTIEGAITALKVSNKVALNAAIESAKTYDGKEANYTKASWSKFSSALAAAKETAESASASEDDYATATKNLTDAQSVLAKVATESQKSALNTEIDKAKDYSESDYTADSWAAYQKALENAKKVAADEDASEDDVVAATNALAKARQALTEPGAASTNNGNAAAATDTAASAGNSAKTGDNLGLLGGAFAAVAAAAAGAAAFARRKFMSK